MSCGDVQSLNVTLQHPGGPPIFQEHRNWEWNKDGDIILKLDNISYCDSPANVSVQRSDAVVMGYGKLNSMQYMCNYRVQFTCSQTLQCPPHLPKLQMIANCSKNICRKCDFFTSQRAPHPNFIG